LGRSDITQQDLQKSVTEVKEDEELARRLQKRYQSGQRPMSINPAEHFRQREVKEHLEEEELDFIDFDEIGKGLSEKLDKIGDGINSKCHRSYSNSQASNQLGNPSHLLLESSATLLLASK
jgi:hypothetical protein